MGYCTYNLLALATDKVDEVFVNSFVLNEELVVDMKRQTFIIYIKDFLNIELLNY